MSAAGAAPQAADRVIGAEGAAAGSGDRPFGVLFNPKGYPWTEDACNVHWGELKRIEELRVAWYGKAFVGDGADGVKRDELDPWQKFAHDIVMDRRHSLASPLRGGAAGVRVSGPSVALGVQVDEVAAYLTGSWSRHVSLSWTR